jgi:hypothetical protein
MTKRLSWAVTALTLLWGGEGQARADLVLDQFNTPTNTGEAIVVGNPSPFDEAQTFTVGVTGTLARIDFLVREDSTSTGNLLFDIRATNGGVPVADNMAVLASVVVPHGTVPTDPLTMTYTGIDVSSFGLSVTEGEMLAIVLRTDTGGRYLWKNGAPVYTRGEPFFREPNVGPDWRSWSSAGANFDFAFRTYVDTTVAVPEPSTLTLLGIGTLSLLGYGWRRRKPAAA